MDCGSLADTGLDAGLGVLLVVAIACLVAGALAFLLTRSRGKGAAMTLLVLLVVGAAAVLAPSAPAQAAEADCGVAGNSLTVTQTSTMAGLAPGTAPVAITGLVVNNGTQSTRLTAVDVEIAGVVMAAGSAAGTCDAGDYLLSRRRMPVDRILGPGGSATFAGASIGFSNASVNQDACQYATVLLLYTANPG